MPCASARCRRGGLRALNPAQQVVKIVNEELVAILGGETRPLRFAKNPPTVIMLAGLQGAGKTTLAGKLALTCKGQGHTPLLVAADLQRPNAVTSSQVVGERAGVPVFAPQPGNQGSDDVMPFGADPVAVARRGWRRRFAVDTWEVAARNRATRAGVENGARWLPPSTHRTQGPCAPPCSASTRASGSQLPWSPLSRADLAAHG